MKKILTVIMLLSLFTSLFGSVNAKAQTAAAPATETPAAATAAPAATTAPAATETPAATPAATDAAATPAATDAAATAANPLENTLYMELKDGRVVIQLLPEVAPNHVKRIKELVRQGFYDGVPFHRVIDGFMAQTGDPTGTGTGGSGQKLDAEFNAEKHVRGTVSMARAADPNSADSQFFIMLEEAPHLDGNYTAFGKVIEGMEFVDKIKKGSGANGMVSEPDKIVKLKVAADEAPADGTAPAAAPAAAAPAADAAATPAAATPAATTTAPATEAPKQ
jgi:peptidylprolyl isomerase